MTKSYRLITLCTSNSELNNRCRHNQYHYNCNDMSNNNKNRSVAARKRLMPPIFDIVLGVLNVSSDISVALRAIGKYIMPHFCLKLFVSQCCNVLKNDCKKEHYLYFSIVCIYSYSFCMHVYIKR